MIISEQDLLAAAAELRRRSELTYSLAKATQVRASANQHHHYKDDGIVRRDQPSRSTASEAQ